MEWTLVGSAITPSRGVGRIESGTRTFYIRTNMGDVHVRKDREWKRVFVDPAGDDIARRDKRLESRTPRQVPATWACCACAATVSPTQLRESP
jgi:hypothetical protein